MVNIRDEPEHRVTREHHEILAHGQASAVISGHMTGNCAAGRLSHYKGQIYTAFERDRMLLGADGGGAAPGTLR
jgi:hypothetical protein